MISAPHPITILGEGGGGGRGGGRGFVVASYENLLKLCGSKTYSYICGSIGLYGRT